LTIEREKSPVRKDRSPQVLAEAYRSEARNEQPERGSGKAPERA